MKAVQFTLLAALAGLAACAVPDAAQRRLLDSMIGHPPVDLVRAFGVPGSSFSAGDLTFLAYQSDNSYEYPGTSDAGWGWRGGWRARGGRGGWGGGWGAYGSSMSGGYSKDICQTVFEIRNNRVISWSIHGVSCQTGLAGSI